jgi:hypothetical protein
MRAICALAVHIGCPLCRSTRLWYLLLFPERSVGAFYGQTLQPGVRLGSHQSIDLAWPNWPTHAFQDCAERNHLIVVNEYSCRIQKTPIYRRQ